MTLRLLYRLHNNYTSLLLHRISLKCKHRILFLCCFDHASSLISKSGLRMLIKINIFNNNKCTRVTCQHYIDSCTFYTTYLLLCSDAKKFKNKIIMVVWCVGRMDRVMSSQYVCTIRGAIIL